MYSDLFSRVYDAFGWNYYPEEFAVLLQRWMEKIRFVCSRCSISAAGTGVLCSRMHAYGMDAQGMDLSEGMNREGEGEVSGAGI